MCVLTTIRSHTKHSYMNGVEMRCRWQNILETAQQLAFVFFLSILVQNSTPPFRLH